MADIKFEGPAIGIDLGTTYSCVAIWQNGGVEIIVNGHGNRTTPSCVAFTEDEFLIGEAAENQWIRNPTNTVFGVKRLIGRRFHDPLVQEHIILYPFKVVAGLESQTKILVNYRGEERQFDPKEISSMILDNMRKIAESYTGRRVTNAVITVPAHFNDSQRRATKEAGELAGLNVIRILNEPMAAAIAYGLQNQIHHHVKDKNILVFDLGGGTFDVSVFNIDGGQLKVKAISGDSCLGGEDFNNRMVSYFCQEFKRKNGKDVSDSPRALRRLRTACERAKRFLSFNTNITVEVDCLYDGIDFESKITRASFEEMNSDLFLRCIEIMEQCLIDGGIDRSDVEEVVLVGGSTRMPKFEKMLKDYFHDTIEICKSINPDECVAYGAAVLAAKLTGEANDDDNTNKILNDLVLSDVTPLSLGIEIFGGVMSTIIPRNTSIPTKKEQIYAFETDGNGTSEIATRIYEGERGFVKDNNFLGEFTLQGIPPSPEGSINEIIISFEIDVDGILTVSILHRLTGLRKNITIDYEVSRSDEEEIANLVKEGEIYREEDEEQGDCVYHKALLEDVLEALKVRLMKLGGEKRRKMEVAVERVSDWLDQNQFAAASEFDGKVMELQEVWEENVGS